VVLHDVLAVTSASINAAVLWLSKKSSELSHNKHGDLLLHEPFFAGQSRPVTEQPQPKDSGVEVQHKVVANAKPSVCVRNVNKKLKNEEMPKSRNTNLRFLPCPRKMRCCIAA